MKAFLYYKLFRLCLSLATKLRGLAIEADPRPADNPADEFPFDNVAQIGWDEKYHIQTI
jgi:hypothetical protein